MITSQCCPYCQQADENEQHILWECVEWVAAKDLHIANVRVLAAKVPDLPPFDRWPPCLKINGLLPEIEPPVNKQVEQHNLPFIQALHAMFVAILVARKLRDQQAPKLFPTVRPQARSAYPYRQLVPPPPPVRLVCLHNPTARTWPWEKPFLADLLAWLRALRWTEDTDAVSFIELALDFEEHAARTLPAAPQAKFQGHTLPLQERARVLRVRYAHFRDWSNRAHSTQPKS